MLYFSLVNQEESLELRKQLVDLRLGHVEFVRVLLDKLELHLSRFNLLLPRLLCLLRTVDLSATVLHLRQSGRELRLGFWRLFA